MNPQPSEIIARYQAELDEIYAAHRRRMEAISARTDAHLDASFTKHKADCDEISKSLHVGWRLALEGVGLVALLGGVVWVVYRLILTFS